MSYIDKSCSEFAEILAAGTPVPGGGSAAALAGAVGTALGNMVGSLTAGKKKYAHVEDRYVCSYGKSGRAESAAS